MKLLHAPRFVPGWAILLLTMFSPACADSGGGSSGKSSPGGTPISSGERFPLWSVLEFDLVASKRHPNPYTDVDVTATFRGPGGVTKTVQGFWDGGKEFRVRFTPTRKGAWTYEIESSPADPGLEDSGRFTVTEPGDDSRGFLRRDPQHTQSFIFDDGTRPFVWGQTYYEIVRNARAKGNWKAAIDGTRRRGMNKVRLLVNPVWSKSGGPYPGSSSFVGDDHDRLDIEHWRALDDVVDHLQDREMIADLILFLDHPRGFGKVAQDHRFIRYVLARYAAYPCVIWCLTNEWNFTGKDAAYWNRAGKIIRSEDPWMSEGQAHRGLSIHHKTRHGFQFFGADWPVHAIVQVGVRNNLPRFRNGDQWGNHGIRTNMGHGMPVINDEYGYITEADKSEPGKSGKFPPYSRKKHRQTIWGIAIAGGFGSAGDAHEHEDGIPFFSAGWHDTPEYGDIERLVEFWSNLEHWTMKGRNDLIASGSRAYARAREGKEYVIYTAVGGTVGVQLEEGRYLPVIFDPRTGRESRLPAVSGGGRRDFHLPEGEDWVLHLKRG